MVVTDTGFSDDAKIVGDTHRIYLVKAEDPGFQFVGRMGREDFEKLTASKY